MPAIKYVLLCLAVQAALLLPACGAGRAYNSNTKSWLGAPIEEMIAAWGKPDAMRTSPEGLKEYVWTASTAPVWNEPQIYNPPVQSSGEDDFEYFKRRAEYDHNFKGEGYYSKITCISFVTVDSAGRVHKISPESFMGLTDCRFVAPPPARRIF